MIKTLFFDCDGVVVKRETRFSNRFARDFNIPMEKLGDFFQNDFLRCEVGNADLKIELKKHLPAWGWQKSVDDLLAYWFADESQLDEQVITYIKQLRGQGLDCCLTTNNEKYRTEYLRENLGLGKIFNQIYSSCSVGFMKPQAEFWQTVYRPTMGEKEQILVIDDNKQFVESAQKFGLQGHYFTNLEDLQNQLEQLRQA